MGRALVILVAGALAGCVGGIDGTGGALSDPGGPAGVIVVQNASGATITAVTISACSAMSHGFSDLPSGVSIGPGQSYSFAARPGCYDVQAGYGTYTGYAVADFNGVQLGAGETMVLTTQ